MRKGQQVSVMEAFSGQQLKRVVDWDNGYVFVCREEEYEKAKKEQREPNTIGFPMEFVKEK